MTQYPYFHAGTAFDNFGKETMEDSATSTVNCLHTVA